MAACHTPTQEARRMVRQAERLADTLPDSTVRLIDSVLHMPAYLSERERMDIALLQAEALFGCRDGLRAVSTLSPVMDDDFFEDKPFLSTSPELERAAAYYARKKQYAKAAHAALYSGFVQQHYNEKSAAMQSFKDAERYGGLVGDSLAVAQAEYRMGRMLFYDGLYQEAIVILEKSERNFGNYIVEKGLLQNMMAACHMVRGNYEDAETCLQQSLMYSRMINVDKVKRKVLNNYAVLYQLQGKYDQAIACLKQNADNSNLNEKESLLINLNLGDAFFYEGKTDSAAFYYKNIDSLLSEAHVKIETKASVYDALSHFAENMGDDTRALKYRKLYESLLHEVMTLRREQAVYQIQQQYDYESLQNTMNRKLIQKQHVITLLGILTIIGLVVLAVSQIRLAKIKKQEAEANANLFHFMEQNKALVESNMAHERKVIDTTQQLSDLLSARLKAMQKLDYCLKTPRDKIALKDLEKEVFGNGDHWEAVKEVLVALYPGLWETLKLKYPEMDEMELRVCMLSRLRLSRLAEATLLGISTSVLDKLRTKVRKTMEQEKTQ